VLAGRAAAKKYEAVRTTALVLKNVGMAVAAPVVGLAFIVLFPEGTYFKGRVGPGKHRLLQLLLKLQGQDGLGLLPFVPIGVAYQPRARGYDVEVSLGPPLRVRDPKQAPALTAALMAQIARLSGL
jgi:1-acyl-sn-glycerol-3-phosphate acyltransferase